MSFIPEEIIGQVLDRCDIVDVISAYVPLKKAGKNFKAPCPFHNEKTPSFVVNPDKQIFHCFGCGVGGNLINFVMKHEHLEFPDAVKMLADKVGIAIVSSEIRTEKADLRRKLLDINELAVTFFHNNLLKNVDDPTRNAREYLKQRLVTLDIVNQFRLGFALDGWDGLFNYLRSKGIDSKSIEQAGLIIAREKSDGHYDRFRNRIIFPIFDSKAKCVAFGARTMEKSEGAKYINSPETPVYTKGEHLYGFHLAKEVVSQEDFVVVVEGYMDFIIPFQAGFKNIVASLGTALTPQQITLIRRYTPNVVMLFDMDKAGESAMIRSLDILIELEMNVKVANLTDGEDPDSFVRKYGVEDFRSRIFKAESLFDYKLNVLRKRISINSVDGKAKVAAEMFPTLSKMSNAVLRNGYLRRLAQILAVSEESLIFEFQKSSTSHTRNREQVNSTVPRQMAGAFRQVEHNILRLLIEEKDFIPVTQKELNVSDFVDEQIKTVISKIYQSYDEGKEFSLANMMSHFEDASIVRFVSELMASNDSLQGDRNRIHRDCIEWIKKDRLKIKKQVLLEQIQQAEVLGETDRLTELTFEFNELVKK